ncbi:MAG: hypothetical protein QM504_06930 [Pseudomonadota bacterium]
MAAIDMQSINRQIFHDGNIQVSPQEVVMYNSQPPVLFKPGYLSEQPSSGYRVYLYGYAKRY